MTESGSGAGPGPVPKFSVIMPLYNKARWVGRAVESVIGQSQQDWELIVIDDGSTDGGGEIVSAIDDPRIAVIRQKNQGVSAARNVGIARARGEWIAFLDADDEWLAKHLRVFGELFKRHPHVMWAAAGYQWVSGGRRASAHDMVLTGVPGVAAIVDDALSLLSGPGLWIGAVVVNRRVFDRIGCFKEAMQTGEDPDLWFRIAIAYPNLAYSGTIVAIYHWVPESLMRGGGVDVDSQQLLLSGYERELKELDEERKRLVKAIIRSRIYRLFVDLVLQERSADAKAVLEMHKAFISPEKMMIYRTLSILPVSWLKELRKVKLALRRRSGHPSPGRSSPR